ncbi:hypothetical protein D3C75_695110 [compost metagenome]
MLVQAFLHGLQHIQGIDAGLVPFNQGAGDAVNDVPGIHTGHTLVGELLVQLGGIAAFGPVHLLAVVQIQLFHQVHTGFLGFLQPGQDTEHSRCLQGSGGDVDPLDIGLLDQLVINPLLLAGLQIVGNPHDNHPGVEGFVLFIGDKRPVLGFIGMGNNQLVSGNQGETSGLEVALLGQGEEIPEELLVALEHFLEFHQAPVGFVQLAVEAVRPGIGLGAVLGDGGKVNTTGKIGNILRLGV